MAEGSVKVIVLSIGFAGLVGAGTAWFMVPRMGAPGGPVVVRAEVGLEAENKKLKELATGLRRDLSEAKIQMAAMRAFPSLNPAAGGAAPGNPPGAAEGMPDLTPAEKEKFERYYRASRAREDADAARALRGVEEAALRATLDRAAKITPLDEGRRDKVVRILADGAERMRAINTRAAAAAPEDKSWVKEAETLGTETRRKLEETLSPEQLKAVDSVLGGEQESGEKR